MHIQNPWVLILLIFPFVIIFFSNRLNKAPAFSFSNGELVKGLRKTWRLRMHNSPILLRMFALLLIIVALSRPQFMLQESKIESEGIDIVLAIDTSTSMLAEDFELGGKRENRLEVVKEVVRDFISNRNSDRIGIVAFASRAYTVSPLTLDYGWLMQSLDRVKIGMIEDGTAIGSGLSSALNRLKDTKAKGKVVILLTDGRNNAGRISPITAAEAAGSLDIKAYTIGAGTKGLAPYPAQDLFGNKVYRQVKIEIDEQILQKIAKKTDAQYFRATDTESLKKIYKSIDKLEKAPIEETGYREYKELFHLFLVPGLVLLLLEMVLNKSLLRRLP